MTTQTYCKKSVSTPRKPKHITHTHSHEYRSSSTITTEYHSLLEECAQHSLIARISLHARRPALTRKRELYGKCISRLLSPTAHSINCCLFPWMHRITIVNAPVPSTLDHWPTEVLICWYDAQNYCVTSWRLFSDRYTDWIVVIVFSYGKVGQVSFTAK